MSEISSEFKFKYCTDIRAQKTFLDINKKTLLMYDHRLQICLTDIKTAWNISAKKDILTNLDMFYHIEKDQDNARRELTLNLTDCKLPHSDISKYWSCVEKSFCLSKEFFIELCTFKKIIKQQKITLSSSLDNMNFTPVYFYGFDCICKEYCSCLNVFEFFEKLENKFLLCQTDFLLQNLFLKSCLKGEAFKFFKNTNDSYSLMKKLLIQKYGNFRKIIAKLNQKREEVGIIPSTYSPCPNWKVIQKKCLLHLEIISKFKTLEKYAQKPLFHEEQIIMEIRYFLPHEMCDKLNHCSTLNPVINEVQNLLQCARLYINTNKKHVTFDINSDKRKNLIKQAWHNRLLRLNDTYRDTYYKNW